MSLADLEAEVERRKALKTASGEPIEPLPTMTVSVADTMPEVMSSIARMRDRWTNYCAGIRPQFDDLPETRACEHHPSVRRGKLFEETAQLSWKHGEFRAAYAPCEECNDQDAQARKRRFWAKRGVPERVQLATLDNYRIETSMQGDACKEVRGWLKRNGVFLLLIGTAGTGKGHLAAAALKVQGNGLFITHADILSDLRASYTLKTTSVLMESWKEAEMLVLDELGVRLGGKDEESLLYQVMAHRYDRRLPTIITSNLELPDVREILGYRLLDRIAEDCVTVVCRWPSFRTGKAAA